MAKRVLSALTIAVLVSSLGFLSLRAQGPRQPATPDAVMAAQTTQTVPANRPEQQKTQHDLSDVFKAPNAQASSDVFKDQAKEGKNSGFDFYRDPLNSDQPNQNPDEIMKQLGANKSKVM